MLLAIEALKDSAVWCWGHKRLAAEGLLVIALLLIGWRYNHDKALLEAKRKEAEGLADGLKEQLTLAHNQIEIVKRDADGRIVYKNIYIPPEGSVVISQKDMDALHKRLGDLSKRLDDAVGKGDAKEADRIRKEIGSIDPELAITVKNHGFTLRPGFGMDWANRGLQARADVKLYFYERWGLIFGGSRNGIGPGISRHLDDVLFWKPQNLEFFIDYNIITFDTHGNQIAGGFRVGF